jgi:putative ABC transport system permease protein
MPAPDRIVESTRDVVRLRASIARQEEHMLEDLFRDVRFGLRALSRSPGFSALAIVTLGLGIGANLVSFYRLQTIDPGYRGDRVLSAEAFPIFSKYPSGDSQVQFYEAALARLQSDPGILSAAVTNGVPLSGSQPGPTPFQIDGQTPEDPDKRPTADVRVASPAYFEMLGVPIIAGRSFGPEDRREGAAVAIVNQAMVRLFAPRDPIASRVSFDSGRTWVTIVGVVGNVRQFGLAEPSIAQVYIPLAQSQGLAGRC